MMNKHFIGLLLGLAVVLSGMIGYQEYILSTGERVILKTAPVDPRDIFRGEYVILSYEISDQAEKLITDETDEVYLTLDNTNSPAIVSHVSTKKPASGIYIKGELGRRWDNDARITFPSLSQYYVPEGQGKVIEDLEPGTLKVEVSVKNGRARITKLLY